MIILAFILILNLFISWWNTKVCGSCWIEANTLGGFGKLVVWSGAIQAAIGFSMIFLFLESGLLGLFVPMGGKFATYVLSLGYLGLIVPAIGTGLVIMAHSWIEAYRRRDFASIGTAAYNGIANAHNISGAVQGIPEAFRVLGGLFEDEDGWKIGLVVVAVIVAFGGGIFLTYALIQHYKGTMALPVFDDAVEHQ